MKKIKIGVIGIGHLGSIHAKLLKNNSTAEISGIMDIDTEKCKRLSLELGVTHITDINEIINISDALIISVPTSMHFEIAMKCINAGKHCFNEKPITQSYSEAIELIKSAEDKNLVIQVGHVERFNPVIAAINIYEMNPLFIESHRLSQFKPRAKDVSVIHDLMIHDIDIILWLVKSKVKSIDANGVNVLTETTDIANARISFENGCVANLTASRISANPMRKMRIFQKDTYLSLDFQEHQVEVYKIYDNGVQSNNAVPAKMLGSIETGIKNKNIYYELPPVVKSNAIAEEQSAFINVVAGLAENPVGAEEAAQALKLAEEIYNLINK
ncbi:MAG: Gfo/Idh/MocA family oxidoreductase [Candidatus Kapaibacterium sp.]